MKATIYHNPRCGTSRGALALLEDTPGVTVEVIDYLRDPPTRATLAALYARAGLTPREGLRAKEPLAAELALTDPGVDDDAILEAMAANPILIERPIVETEKGVRLCRPKERVGEIL